MRYDVVVTVVRQYKIAGMEAIDQDDVRDQLNALDGADELNANADVNCDDIVESEAYFEIDEIQETEDTDLDEAEPFDDED